MAIQMLSISILFLCRTFSYTLDTVLSVCGVNTVVLDNMLVFVENFVLIDVLLYPFIYTSSSSEVRNKMKKKMFCLRNSQITPWSHA